MMIKEAHPPDWPQLPPTESNSTTDAQRDEDTYAPVRDAVMFSPPPPFGGQPGEDFREWLKRFNRWGLSCHYTDPRKCEILPVLLEGRAENIYDAVPKEKRGDYKALTDMLIERLQPPRLSDLRSVELHSRQQHPGEAVADYARDIQMLTRQAYPEIDTGSKGPNYETYIFEWTCFPAAHICHALRSNNF